MKKKSVHFIEEQQTRVRLMNENDRDSDSYTSWHERGGTEPTVANPDLLTDSTENKVWGEGHRPELAQLIIEKFADDKGYFPVLSKRQNEVLRLYLLGMEVRAIALELKRDLRNVNRTIKQIQRRFQRLLKAVDL